jgi:hypothetical protein
MRPAAPKHALQRLAALWLLAMAGLAVSATNAAAVPAFAAQTGEPCQACHVGGFGPQLTPFGREFKLQGYTLRTNDKSIPLSAMVVASYLRTEKAQNPPPAPYNANDNWALDQFSLFFAGGFGEHLGAFVQGTYDGIAQAWHWDNLDLRATTTVKVQKTDVTLGASLNNAPTVEDAWNTLPAWGYPYTTSTLAPGPATSPLLNGALAQTSLGMTAYAWINSEVYLEGGAYWSPSANALSSLGVDPTDPGSIKGAAPYGRVAFQHDIGKTGTLEVGAFGLHSDIYPGLDHTTGFTDGYTDLGLDASYVDTLANTDVLSINGRLLHERQSLAATCALSGGDQTCVNNTLNDVHVDASYYWRDKIGFTVGAFDTTGSANPIIYAGNRTLRPDSTGVLLQLDATPWGDGKSPLGKRFNTRVGVQYTAYTRFNGARDNWDGAGSNAADNNALRLFIWSAY